MRRRQEQVIPGRYVLQLLESGLLPDAVCMRLTAALAQAGLPPDSLMNPDVAVPLHVLDEPFRTLGEEQAVLLALTFGEQARMTSHGSHGLFVMTAATIRQALGVLRYIPIITDAVGLGFVEAPDAGYLLLDMRTPSPQLDRMLLFYVATAIMRLIHLLTGHAAEAVTHVTGPRPPGLENHAGFHAAHWLFEAPANALVLPPPCLDRPSQFADPVAHAAAARVLELELQSHHARSGIVFQVQQRLGDAATVPNQEEVAGALHMSRSTLKRLLAQQGTTFNQMLAESRKQKAIRWLLESSMGFQEIAERLGYSDPTNFTHAFKKWTGVAPGVFRRQAR